MKKKTQSDCKEIFNERDHKKAFEMILRANNFTLRFAFQPSAPLPGIDRDPVARKRGPAKKGLDHTQVIPNQFPIGLDSERLQTSPLPVLHDHLNIRRAHRSLTNQVTIAQHPASHFFMKLGIPAWINRLNLGDGDKNIDEFTSDSHIGMNGLGDSESFGKTGCDRKWVSTGAIS